MANNRADRAVKGGTFVTPRSEPLQSVLKPRNEAHFWGAVVDSLLARQNTKAATIITAIAA
jgi:hypothetical protein